MNGNTTNVYDLTAFFNKYDTFLVLSHVHPDGDAIGSSLAVYHFLRELGKNVFVYNEDNPPATFAFLPGVESIQQTLTEEQLTRCQAVVAVDAASEDRLGNIYERLPANVPLLNIDHHPTNTCFGTLNHIQAHAASTTEIIYHLFCQSYASSITKAVAECLYTGLVTDTGGFRYSNVNRNVFETAAELIDFGLEPSKIAEYALDTIELSHLRLLRLAIDTLRFACQGKVAVVSLTVADFNEAQADEDNVGDIVSYPRKIQGVEVGVFLRQRSENEVKVSLRSKTDVNVAEIAQQFGGGGHAKAAGYTFSGTMDDAYERLIQALHKVFSV